MPREIEGLLKQKMSCTFKAVIVDKIPEMGFVMYTGSIP